MVSQKAKAAGAKKLHERRIELRNSLWNGEDGIETKKLWIRNKHDGYTTLPRTFPYIARIMDRESGKGTPLSGTYLALWSNVFDECFLEIKEKKRYAFESGFSGERSVTTWTNRMRKLEELGFIESRNGTEGEFNYVLIINPLEVCKVLCQGKENDELFNSLIARMSSVGAKFENE